MRRTAHACLKTLCRRSGLAARAVFLFFLPLLLGACAPQGEAEPASAQPGAGQPASAVQESTASDAEQGPRIVWTDGEEIIEESLPAGQQELIEAYFSRYYEALVTLEVPDFSELFASDAGAWLSLHEQTMAYIIGLRSMRPADLCLADYRSELALEEAGEETAEAYNQAVLTETSTQNFACHPQVDSMVFGVRHTFVFVREHGEWRIKEHTQWDGSFWSMMRELGDDGPEGLPDAEDYFAARRAALLAEAEAELALREEDREERETLADRRAQAAAPAEGEPSGNLVLYDRDAAASYGASWIGRRNEDWWDYSRQGGNCQNFVSQCLYAGGIPMDTQGDAVWKWYGEAINDLDETRGCSASWINVDYFYQYAQENEGYGLAAQTDASYWEGDIGDVILMGPSHDLNHSVLISGVVRDAEGRTVDYLIHSNTSDVRDFPVSIYPNPRQVLVRILGRRE